MVNPRDVAGNAEEEEDSSKARTAAGSLARPPAASAGLCLSQRSVVVKWTDVVAMEFCHLIN